VSGKCRKDGEVINVKETGLCVGFLISAYNRSKMSSWSELRCLVSDGWITNARRYQTTSDDNMKSASLIHKPMGVQLVKAVHL
jgi:hypothetical protein